jgi:hypothetical protein
VQSLLRVNLASDLRRFPRAIRERNPVELMQRRAEALTQRATDLKKLADAWDRSIKTLTFAFGKQQSCTLAKEFDGISGGTRAFQIHVSN